MTKPEKLKSSKNSVKSNKLPKMRQRRKPLLRKTKMEKIRKTTPNNSQMLEMVGRLSPTFGTRLLRM